MNKTLKIYGLLLIAISVLVSVYFFYSYFGQSKYETYTDEISGFTLKYPNTYKLVERQDACSYISENISDSKQPLFIILTPECSPALKTFSFEDFKKDFNFNGPQMTELRFHLVSSENIKTRSGLTGLYQKFTGVVVDQNTNTPNDFGQRRYVFKQPKNGYLIFQSGHNDLDGESIYKDVEKEVVDSLIYN